MALLGVEVPEPTDVDDPAPGASKGRTNQPTRRTVRRGLTLSDSHTNGFIAACVVAAATAALVILEPRLWHWFVVPVSGCGVLVGVDVVAWLRRQLDIFDPRALFALLGLHFFYVAPMMHVILDYWTPNLVPPVSWRDALGSMAVLNVVGLGVYRYVVGFPIRMGAAWGGRFALEEKKFCNLVASGITVGVGAFGVELMLFGGIDGFLSTMTQGRDVLTGLGWLLAIGESFPMLVFTLVVVRFRHVLRRRPALVVVILLALAVVQFLVGGLRGSRSNTVWPVLLGLVLVHLLVFRISRRSLLVFVLCFGSFMYLYGLYKSVGTDVVDILRGQRTVADVAAETGRDVPTLLLGDLSRADIQALLLDRKRHGVGELGYGMSYVGDVAVLVPRMILPERPPSKVAFGTETLVGPGEYDPVAGQWITRVYGAAGEAMLNFGPVGAPASFLLLALLVRGARRVYLRARHGASLAAGVLAPSLSLAAVLMLTSDLDNILTLLITRFVPLGIAVFLASAMVTTRVGPSIGGQRRTSRPSVVASRTAR